MSVDTWRANTLPGNYRRPPSPGEYVSINFRAKKEKTKKDLDVPQAEYIAMDTQHPKVANGDYTKMTFEPETWRSQPPSVTDQKVEKASKTTPESMSGLVTAEVNSRSVSKKASRPTSTIEKTLKPSTEDDPWPMVASDNTFRPIAPADNKLSLTAKVPTEAQVDSALGLAEKTIATKPPSEDLELRGLLAGCSLYNGPDRNRLVRGDHPARTRHCSDNLSLNTVASCNGNRAQSKESGLNYIDLDLVKDVRTSPLTAYLVSANVPQPMKSGTLGANPCINTYASIDFQMSGELRRDSRDGTEC